MSSPQCGKETIYLTHLPLTSADDGGMFEVGDEGILRKPVPVFSNYLIILPTTNSGNLRAIHEKLQVISLLQWYQEKSLKAPSSLTSPRSVAIAHKVEAWSYQ